jgi:hypothetical protein
MKRVRFSHQINLFEIMITVAIQSTFHLEIHQNDIFFLFFKINKLKQFENIKI